MYVFNLTTLFVILFCTITNSIKWNYNFYYTFTGKRLIFKIEETIFFVTEIWVRIDIYGYNYLKLLKIVTTRKTCGFHSWICFQT